MRTLVRPAGILNLFKRFKGYQKYNIRGGTNINRPQDRDEPGKFKGELKSVTEEALEEIVVLNGNW